MKEIAEFLPEIDWTFNGKDNIVGWWLSYDRIELFPEFFVESFVGTFEAERVAQGNAFGIEDNGLEIFLWRIDADDYLTVNKLPCRLQGLLSPERVFIFITSSFR